MTGILSKAFVPAEVIAWIKKYPNGHHLFFGIPSEELISKLGLIGFLKRVEKGRFDGVSDDLTRLAKLVAYIQPKYQLWG